MLNAVKAFFKRKQEVPIFVRGIPTAVSFENHKDLLLGKDGFRQYVSIIEKKGTMPVWMANRMAAFNNHLRKSAVK